MKLNNYSKLLILKFHKNKLLRYVKIGNFRTTFMILNRSGMTNKARTDLDVSVYSVYNIQVLNQYDGYLLNGLFLNNVGTIGPTKTLIAVLNTVFNFSFVI